MPIIYGGQIDIQYSIEPDFNTVFKVGDTISVAGKFRVNNGHAKSIDFGFVTAGGTIFELGYVNQVINSGQTYNFYMTATIPEFALTLIAEGNLYQRLGICFGAFNNTGGYYDPGLSGHMFAYDEFLTDSVYLCEYELSPKIVNAEFVRFNGVDIDDEGEEVLCKNLKITINSKASSTDLTSCSIIAQSVNDPSDRITGTLTDYRLRQALTAQGWSETTATIFTNRTFKIGSTYELTITIGDEHFSAVQTLYIEKAFANMCLSGAANGGVSFGAFPSSTDETPKFESQYVGYFYKGFDNDTIKFIGNVLYPVGSIYMNAEEDYDQLNYPENVFGGEWEKIEGRFLVGSEGLWDFEYPNDPGEIGGSLEHQHLAPIGVRSSNTGTAITNKFGAETSQTFSGSKAAVTTSNNTTTYNDFTVPYTSTAYALPPYLVVNMWKRISLYDPNKND